MSNIRTGKASWELMLDEKNAEIDRLRAENENWSKMYTKLNVYCASVERERDTLRELVREVYDNADVGWLGTSWDERAEKALRC